MPGGVTVREILRLPPLANARLVAGESGLDRRVLHVNVMEVPDILPWVEPDELLLTTAYPLRDDRVALALRAECGIYLLPRQEAYAELKAIVEKGPRDSNDVLYIDRARAILGKIAV